MGWPTIPPTLGATDFVTIRRAGTWTQDRSGGRVRNLGIPSAPVPCSFTPVNSLRNLGQAANFRESMTAFYIVTFTERNPGLHINDELTWLGEGKVLTVVGLETTGPPTARLWNARVQEKSIP